MGYKVAELDLLIVPDGAGLDSDHWQARWVRQLRTARTVEVWELAQGGDAARTAALARAVAAAERPVMLVGHGLGALAIVKAAPALAGARIAGALLVAPTDWNLPAISQVLARAGFPPVSSDPLPFPSLVVASRNDPLIGFETAQGFAFDWGSDFADAGEAGHIDAASGHGPWPEGLLRFGVFLKTLAA
ncbi:MAG: alpha/beta hydrolase [Hyphomicrobiaceae bacterium]